MMAGSCWLVASSDKMRELLSWDPTWLFALLWELKYCGYGVGKLLRDGPRTARFKLEMRSGDLACCTVRIATLQ